SSTFETDKIKLYIRISSKKLVYGFEIKNEKSRCSLQSSRYRSGVETLPSENKLGAGERFFFGA
ncbi:hypothetical protein, partial [uncultured Microscilla sp.]|uniref:hypothetical protein n=1 Tax=uncultured Microscilla sp. TaxID=432653 RepID=UPI0026077BE9